MDPAGSGMRALGARPGARRRLAVTAAAAAAALLAASCLDWLKWTFQVTEPIDEYTIAGDPTGGLLTDVQTVSLDVSQQPDFQAEEYDKVYSIFVRSLAFAVAGTSEDPGVDSLEDGEPDDFSFVDSFRICITARVGGVDTTELLAYVDQGDPQLAPGTRSVDLHVVDMDIVDFVFAEGGYAVRIEATGLLPPDDVVFTGSVTYDVTVGLFE